VSVKVNQVVVIDSPPSSEPPNADLQVKTLLEPKPPDMGERLLPITWNSFISMCNKRGT
ncbi:hypothetical protein L195_g063959, partial [Trifolium pratense]